MNFSAIVRIFALCTDTFVIRARLSQYKIDLNRDQIYYQEIWVSVWVYERNRAIRLTQKCFIVNFVWTSHKTSQLSNKMANILSKKLHCMKTGDKMKMNKIEFCAKNGDNLLNLPKISKFSEDVKLNEKSMTVRTKRGRLVA